MDNLINGGVSIAIAIVGVALLAVLVSRNAQTPAVIQASGNAFANALNAATGPVSGNHVFSGGYGYGNTQMGPGYFN